MPHAPGASSKAGCTRMADRAGLGAVLAYLVAALSPNIYVANAALPVLANTLCYCSDARLLPRASCSGGSMRLARRRRTWSRSSSSLACSCGRVISQATGTGARAKPVLWRTPRERMSEGN